MTTILTLIPIVCGLLAVVAIWLSRRIARSSTRVDRSAPAPKPTAVITITVRSPPPPDAFLRELEKRTARLDPRRSL